MTAAPRYPGIRVTANGNQLVSYHTETRIADASVFYPITPSTEMGELYQQSYAEGRLNVFGHNTLTLVYDAQRGEVNKTLVVHEQAEFLQMDEVCGSKKTVWNDKVQSGEWFVKF